MSRDYKDAVQKIADKLLTERYGEDKEFGDLSMLRQVSIWRDAEYIYANQCADASDAALDRWKERGLE